MCNYGRYPKMGIKLYLPSRFYYLWEGKEVLDVTGKTVAECLDELVRLFPLMKKALSYESGRLDPHIKVLVNQEGVGAVGLARKVHDGDEIHFELGTH
jgi:molybdopterin converting factor small subunit